VIAASPRTDLFNPNAIRASAGTMFTVPTGAAPTSEVLAWLRDRGLRIVAARVGAGHPYTETDLTGPLAIVLGAEADGLTDAWTADGIEAINLPMLGVADSLNVSISAAILLYEARRQRGFPNLARKE
jgi:TrmH family RNA methyltransferase